MALSFLAKAMLGGGGRRMMTGAIAGGLYGGLSSDSNTATGTFRDVMGGALVGLGIGAATTRTAMSLAGAGIKGAMRLPHTMRAAKAARGLGAGPFEALSFGHYAATHSSGFKNFTEGLRGLGNVGLSIGKAGTRMAKFAIKNPKTSLALAGGTVGLTALAMSGPGESSMSAEAMNTYAASLGTPSTGVVGPMFENSTQGLVQGLHRGRHRG